MRACSVARVVVEQVAEQPDRALLGAVGGAATRGRTTFAPRCAYSSGITHACARHASATGSASGFSHISSAAAPTNGTMCAAVVSVHSAPARRRRSSSTRGRQWTAAVSGRTSRPAASACGWEAIRSLPLRR